MSVETSRRGPRPGRADGPAKEKRNALNAAITAGIDAAMNEFEDDPELWCGNPHRRRARVLRRRRPGHRFPVSPQNGGGLIGPHPPAAHEGR